MKLIYSSLILAPLLMVACIKDEPLNAEADILTFTYPKQDMRTESPEIYNDYVVVYPNAGTDLTKIKYNLSVTPGATHEEIPNRSANDTLFFIQVRSENKENAKLYAITQVPDTFPDVFTFERWIKYTDAYLYENPKDGAYQWFSSNNGAALAYRNFGMPAQEYPVTKAIGAGHDGSTAVKLLTKKGPGNIYGNISVPCLAGSFFLGGFSPLSALQDPLSSTKFGVPFRKGKPLRLQGYYHYKAGSDSFIVDETTTSEAPDSCSIYAVLFQAGANAPFQFLDGNTIGTSLQRIARAELPNHQRGSMPGNDLVEFSTDFVYLNEQDNRYPAFSEVDLKNNQYKITIVCSSSYRGDYYQGRPGSCLIVDDIRVVCE
jgi:hypothetical protein